MKKLAGVLMVAALVMVGTQSYAKNVAGRFGLGYDQSLGGASGITATYWFGNFGVKSILGFDMVIPDKGDSAMGFDFALGGIYNFARAKNTNLGIGLMLDLGFRNKAAMDGTDSSFQFNLEVPLRVEYFVTEHFALNLATGIVFAIIPEKGQVLNNSSATGLKTVAPKSKELSLGAGNIFGTAGFTFYW